MGATANAGVRRSRCLVLRWDHGEFVATNYLLGRDSTIPPALASALHALDAPVCLPELAEQWTFCSSAQLEDLVERLVDVGILVVSGSALDARERALHAAWRWGQEAQWYHFATQGQRFQGSPEAERAAILERVAYDPPPPAFLSRGPIDVSLPSPGRLPASLETVLEARRTCRRFSSTPLSLHTLSSILGWVWGAQRQIEDPPLGTHLVKTSPSGGARHPTEVYALVMAVDSIETGVYHYSVLHHGLTRITGALDAELVVRVCGGQRWFGTVPVVFLMTSVLARSMWKYPIAHAYRVLHMDAGHLGQTFHLVCTALRLGPITSAALDYSLAEQILRIDGIMEMALYAAAAGHPE